VYDGVRFHRIDLGGAAGRMELDPRTADHLYRPPPDAFNWPEGSESGQAMLSETLEGTGKSVPNGAPAASAARPASPAPAPSALGLDAQGRRQSAPGDDRPHSSVELKLASTSGQRGATIQISGNVQAAGEPCLFSRVDVSLRDSAGAETWLGAFPTDGKGNLEGRVTVPFDIDVGDYQVVAKTPGTGRCGANR
jgi:hypothetical protein